MALNAVVFPPPPLPHGCSQFPLMFPHDFLHNFALQTHESETFPVLDPVIEENHASVTTSGDSKTLEIVARRKRRRSRSRKNKEDIENQRMTHITVERNRRKQMNEYLSTLRALMPESYVQRGDQASIIGGAINFVKELEQSLHVSTATRGRRRSQGTDTPFSDFFAFPQYRSDESSDGYGGPGIADIEVTMVENHASLKIRSRKWPRQLLKIVTGLHSMRITILHLNVTTSDQIVLYSLSIKVEDDCNLTSVDEIATAMYRLLSQIQGETC